MIEKLEDKINSKKNQSSFSQGLKSGFYIPFSFSSYFDKKKDFLSRINYQNNMNSNDEYKRNNYELGNIISGLPTIALCSTLFYFFPTYTTLGLISTNVISEVYNYFNQKNKNKNTNLDEKSNFLI